MARTKNTQPTVSDFFNQRMREGLLILCLAFCAFLLLSLLTYHSSDPGWSGTGTGLDILNACGKTGAWIADFSLYIFGYMAYLFPILLAYTGWQRLRAKSAESEETLHNSLWEKGVGFLLIFVCATSLFSLHMPNVHAHVPYSAGGILGSIVSDTLAENFNHIGASLMLFAGLLTGVTLFTGFSWVKFSKFLMAVSILGLQRLREVLANYRVKLKERQQAKQELAAKPVIMVEEAPKKVKKAKKSKKAKPLPHIAEDVTVIEPSKRAQKEKQIPMFQTGQDSKLPGLFLLNAKAKTQHKAASKAYLEEKSIEVEQRLKDFNVDAEVVAVHPGPVITRYELSLAPGVKVSKITGLAKDLARSLSMVSVRVVEVIPGKAVIGLELPNETRAMVTLKEVLEAEQYEQARSPLSLALGKDIAGHPVIVDLAKMPHLLVAGTTGSGKSVGLNAMLLSLLYKSTPQEVRMILIDPKMLELAIYEGIPHLLAPVVTDMKEAAHALRWCVAEMERRYKLMASLGVRNLNGFNNKVSEAIQAGEPIVDPFARKDDPDNPPPNLEPLPYIVVLVDEFADMMMVVGKKVEQLIARIAQKARAAGIHLILATQRPSVDVITGLIKANVPTRIAFQVSSKVDSRTIIDQQGAEQLLGHGDMLYLPPGSGVPVRVHGAFVDDQEVHNVVAELKKHSEPLYIDEITSGASDADGMGGFGLDEEKSTDTDPLYDHVIEFIAKNRRASISSVQRRFKIGYNRAARIIEELEATGVVGPMENGSREVLVPPPQE